MDFYGFDKNTVKKTRINRDFNQRKTSFSIKQIFLFNNQENLMLGFKGLSHETSNEVNISQIGSYSVELKAFNEDHYELFEFAVTVSLKKSGIFFDFFEFFKVFCIIYTWPKRFFVYMYTSCLIPFDFLWFLLIFMDILY